MEYKQRRLEKNNAPQRSYCNESVLVSAETFRKGKSWQRYYLLEVQ